ncbi:MAG TPA: potassium channel family protein [Pilimelia sp.]|nr:potassium channel family protein [Pilimelia sp.]
MNAPAAVHIPVQRLSPLRALSVRIGAAVGLIVFVVAAVYLDRDGYQDAADDTLTVLDCFYYAVVSLSTTGYGDITPVSSGARLVNVLLVTPARVLFVIILVGTTLEILTEQYRTDLRVTRWRRTVKDHVIVCGYGTKGRSAVATLLENNLDRRYIVVVEHDSAAVREAVGNGLVVVQGSATRSAILMEAGLTQAKTLIVATDSDDAALLVTLTARQLTAGKVRIVAAARELENAQLLKQSGAHHVIVSSATTGRLLGLSTSMPPLIDVVEDLLSPGQGMGLAVRSATRDECGRSPRELPAVVIALIRRGQIVPTAEPEAATIQPGDQLVFIGHRAPNATTTARP